MNKKTLNQKYKKYEKKLYLGKLNAKMLSGIDVDGYEFYPLSVDALFRCSEQYNVMNNYSDPSLFYSFSDMHANCLFEVDAGFQVFSDLRFSSAESLVNFINLNIPHSATEFVVKYHIFYYVYVTEGCTVLGNNGLYASLCGRKHRQTKRRQLNINNPMGNTAWNPSVTYIPGANVLHDNKTYEAQTTNTGANPLISPSDWKRIISQPHYPHKMEIIRQIWEYFGVTVPVKEVEDYEGCLAATWIITNPNTLYKSIDPAVPIYAGTDGSPTGRMVWNGSQFVSAAGDTLTTSTTSAVVYLDNRHGINGDDNRTYNLDGEIKIIPNGGQGGRGVPRRAMKHVQSMLLINKIINTSEPTQFALLISPVGKDSFSIRLNNFDFVNDPMYNPVILGMFEGNGRATRVLPVAPYTKESQESQKHISFRFTKQAILKHIITYKANYVTATKRDKVKIVLIHNGVGIISDNYIYTKVSNKVQKINMMV